MSTSTTQNPSDALVVQTATGFNQGDMVYFRGDTNNYTSTAGLVATGNGNFNVSETTGLISNGSGAMVRPVFGFADGLVNPSLMGGSRQRFASVLTNGNIVQVYRTDNNFIHFQIVTAAGATVVSVTTVSSTFTETAANPGVVALTGGGFVVFWVNAAGGTTQRPCYAVYDNTGAVVVAPINDTAIGAVVPSDTPLRGVALQNGGFALVTTDNSNQVRFRAFNATAVAAYPWTLYATAAISTRQFGVSIASRSDNSILIAFRSSATIIRYSIRNTSGASIVDASITTTTTNAQAVGTTTLVDGTTFVIGYNTGGTQTNCVRLLPASNTLGSEIQVPSANYFIGSGNNAVTNTFHSLLGLANGNFVYAFTDYTLAIQLVVFNSSGVVLSGTNASGAVPRIIPSSANLQYSTVTMLEYGGNINFFWTPDSQTTFPFNQSWARINSTTFDPVFISSSSQLITSVSAPLGAPVVASAGPNSLPFFAANTETITVTGALPTTATAPTPTPVVAATCRGIATATLPNGKVLIAYQRISGETVFVARYSATMVLEQTITVGTAASSQNYLKIAALPNGGFAVGRFTSASVYAVATYNSSMVLLGSATVSSVSNGATVGVGLAGLTSNRSVFAYRDSGSSTLVNFVIFDGTATGSILNTSNAINVGNGVTSVAVAADNAGGFMVACQESVSNNIVTIAFYNNSGTSYASTGQFNTGSGSASNNATAFFAPGGNYVYVGSRSSVFDLMAYSTSTASFTGSFTSGVGGITASLFSASTTGNGSVAAVINNGGTLQLYALTGGISPENNTGNAITVTTISSAAYNFLAQPIICMTPGQGYNAIIAWLDASNSPVFINVNMFPFRTTTNIVAGVSTTNAAVPIFPNTGPVTPAVNNAVLTGVAGSAATAGGSGVVLTRGNTQLNTSYSNSTVAQTFDHQSPNGTGMPGVKGYIVGRNVNLQGAE